MPYQTNDELPPSVRDHLPEHAQSIFREAFNSALESHRGQADGEARAFRIAWAAVKRSYRKVADRWQPRGRDQFRER